MFKGFQQLGSRSININQQLFDGYFKPFNKSAVLNNYVIPYEWWSAEANYIIDGSNRVSSWKGMYKQFDFIQATLANQPILTASALDGRNSLKFNGSTQRMVCTFPETFAQPNTILVIWKRESSGTATNIAFDGIDSSNRQVLYNSLNQNTMQGGVGLSYDKTPPFDFILSTCVYNFNVSMIYENGVLKNTGTLTASTLKGLTVGSRYGGVAPLNGEVTDIIFFNRTITPQEMRQMHQLLANYYPSLNITI